MSCMHLEQFSIESQMICIYNLTCNGKPLLALRRPQRAHLCVYKFCLGPRAFYGFW